jgi:hypothetical protein
MSLLKAAKMLCGLKLCWKEKPNLVEWLPQIFDRFRSASVVLFSFVNGPRSVWYWPALDVRPPRNSN